MTRGRTVVAWLAALAGAAAAACARPAPIVVLEPHRQDLIVLLPDADGSIGRATVSTVSGTVELAGLRAATVVTRNATPPAAVRTMSEHEVRQLFGAAIAALPPPPRDFTLFFRFNSEELTDESRALFGEVLRTARARAVPDVVVRGHTDTTGQPSSNFALGLKRANAVRALLIQSGLDRASIDVTSHGEAELLVPSADNIPEPRNRRVEITVR